MPNMRSAWRLRSVTLTLAVRNSPTLLWACLSLSLSVSVVSVWLCLSLSVCLSVCLSVRLSLPPPHSLPHSRSLSPCEETFSHLELWRLAHELQQEKMAQKAMHDWQEQLKTRLLQLREKSQLMLCRN